MFENLSNHDLTLLFSGLFILIMFGKFLNNKYGEKYSHKWRKKSASKVLEKIQAMEDRQIFTYLRKIDPFVMEELVLNALDKREDIEIKRNKKYTGDNGVDGRFYHIRQDDKGEKIRKKYVVQVKRYKSYINLSHLKEFSEQIQRENAYAGIFVHTGKTGKNSSSFVNEIENMQIISGQKLIRLVKESYLKLQ